MIHTNPIPKSGLFTTPSTPEELLNYCLQFSGAERTIAVTVAAMALNLSHKMVNDLAEIEKELGLTS
jgi:hypothetical protein